MPFNEIYDLLIDNAHLSDEHKQELITKRGFSEATIEREKLKSGGDYLLPFEDTALDLVKSGRFSEQDLIRSGVFISDSKKMRLNPMLLKPKNAIGGKEFSNILIPYRDKSGSVYHMRPHKLGFSGISVETYQEFYLRDKPEEIILTEGEFKAMASWQYGIPAIAIPGISSFSEKEWPRLLKLINDAEVKRIVIMFDNETKDDPKLPNYKDNPYDRYDTQFYAYYMASKLEKEAKEVFIATLPDGWKVNGKIDIDGASAMLKTTGEMKKVVYDALPRLEYLRELNSEARQNVLRKMNQKFYRSKVKKEFNKYVVTRHKGKTSYEEPISNFVMKVIATHDTPEGVKREIEFVNEFGSRSSSFTISPADMASPDSFRTFALSRGDFIWRGSIEDLLTIWESEFLMMDEGRYIIESDHLGWVQREKIWLFGNVAIKEDGTELRPDQNGIFWLEKRGIKPISLSITSGKNTDFGGIPTLNTNNGFDIEDFRIKMGETIGRNEANVMLGWVASVAFMEEIFATYRSFPFLFVTGRFQSGKSTIAEWIANFFGIENAAKSISQTTPVAIQRSLAYYSCLPVCLDEYRNTKDISYKTGFLRNVYNRQGAGKGLKEDFGLRDAKVRGTLIIAGEETPKDPALLSRCIVIFVSRSKREKNHFTWFQKNRLRFSNFFFSIMKTKNKKIDEFFRSIAEWKEFFTKNDVDDRNALNYSTIMAGYQVVFGDDIKFAEWLVKETKTVQGEHQDEQAVNVFFEDLGALKTRKLIDDNYWVIHGTKVYFYFHGLHQIWAQEFRKTRGDEAFKEASIRSYLKEENGYIGISSFRIKGHMKKCVVFELEKAPDEIKNLVDMGMEGAML